MLRADDTGLTLLWTVETAGVRYSQIDVPGLALSEQAGYPPLPIYSGLVGLPPSGQVWLRVSQVHTETLSHAPTDASALAQLGPPQWVRGRRLALLTILPVRVNPRTGLRLEITFESPPGRKLAPAQDPFTQALAAVLINPTAARWQAPRAPASSPLQHTLVITGNPLKVLVNQAGLYALFYDDLADAGLPLESLDPRALRLTHGLQRQEIAILVVGESDGAFDPGDRVLFYAEPEFSRFTDSDVYLLDQGQTNGLRMAAQSGDPSGLPLGNVWRTAQAETNQFYESRHAGRDGDHW
ncbi:MAG: hypothetical protein GY824_05205, partial [Delftia sp.]|nr:hypothetical protein [Delftia sp.]